MSESWGEFFSRVGTATVRGLELVGKAMSQVEVAFDANAQRGAGILWLPRSNQALYYTINWAHSLDLRGKSEVEIQLLNALLGLSMWGGLINSNRVAREPVIKIGCNFIQEMEFLGEGNEDLNTLWRLVSSCEEGISRRITDTSAYDAVSYEESCWDHIRGAKLTSDMKFKQVQRLSNGQMLLPNSEGLSLFNLVNWNPQPVFGVIIPLIPDKYIR